MKNIYVNPYAIASNDVVTVTAKMTNANGKIFILSTEKKIVKVKKGS